MCVSIMCTYVYIFIFSHLQRFYMESIVIYSVYKNNPLSYPYPLLH